MKRYIFFFSLFLSGILFHSCSNDDILTEVPIPNNPDESIRFEVSVNTPTRITTEGSTYQSKWTENDAIGIFAARTNNTLSSAGNYADNIKLTYNGSTWTLDGSIPKALDGLDFYAYYPYDKDINPTSINFTVQSNQNESGNFNRSEFLYATAKNQTTNVVQLNMKHALAMVEVEPIPHQDWPENTFQNGEFTVELKNVYTNGIFDWDNGVIAETPQATPTDISMHRVSTDDNSWLFRALVPVQTINEGTTLFHFTQKSPEVDLTYTLADELSLSANTVAKYKITLLYQSAEDQSYAIGDYYPNENAPIGVVFEVSEGGKHGKIVSLNENEDNYTLYSFLLFQYYGLKWSTSTSSTKTETGNGLLNMITIQNINSNFSNYPAFKEIHGLNDSGTQYTDNATGVWYLPAISELQHLLCTAAGKSLETWGWTGSDNRSASYPSFNSSKRVIDISEFNKTLTSKGGDELKTGNNQYYWSSTENSNLNAYYVRFDNGSTTTNSKSTYYRARAILAF